MRATLDKLISGAGLLLAVVLLAIAGLATWASVFVGNQVHDQLAAQHITMPTAATGLSSLPAADQAVLKQYSGQSLTTGPQARAYADHFIAVHLGEAAGGKTYSEVSGQYIAQCSTPKAAATTACTTLSGLKQTMFQGETLRGLLLYGFAFATVGTIAGYAAIAGYVGFVLLMLLVGLGFWHSRRADRPVVAAQGQLAGAHV
jgi:hypothetical protein